ncbi:hypothetical protein DAKH74_010050 [Maudiozyma humilis]|uniref:BHLH domain-containing protein n=1 Tax=Maudiozyma humilis TaxID=51915 RepID=A0AAV5RS15_MAUHU|nr:hypothetical protein DAKH74_010050 [Kazachstania humilis]
MNALIVDNAASNAASNASAPLDAWMLPAKDIDMGMGMGMGLHPALTDSDSNSWFEPLEALLSSASSPATETDSQQSPLLASLKSATDLPVLVKQEPLASLDAVPAATAPTATTPAPKRGRKRLTAHQKQAHNKIEKRYRININTKIAKLQQIIPWVAAEQAPGEIAQGTNATTAPAKLNKSMVLEKAVDYILYLQNNERLHEMEVNRLRAELDAARRP